MSKNKLTTRIIFFATGISATIWFLIRVIPKPSRAAYPCMRAAAPVMSGFVLYLLSMGGSILAFRKAKKLFLRAKYLAAFSFLLVALVFTAIYFYKSSALVKAENITLDEHPDGVNQPMGVGKGIHPGRVVWAWDKDATNENCTNKVVRNAIVTNENSDLYYSPKNNNQQVIDNMVDSSITQLTENQTSTGAWDALFRYFNNSKGKGNVGYQAGEIVFIKINATSPWMGGPCPPDQYWGKFDAHLNRLPADADIVETTPFTVYAIIKQLVENANVPQQNIYVGDPMKNIYQDMYDLWKQDFPDINVLGNDIYYPGLDVEGIGRVAVEKGVTDDIYYSDKGAVIKEKTDAFYTIVEDADYMINIASLKAHACAGITLCAKNHFGSHTRNGAGHLHPALLGATNDDITNGGYNKYRVQVDLMGNKYLGANTLLFIVDGLYSGQEGYSGANSVKWRMPPFNNDYPSSIFMSQDDVALESVCFDFLWTEYDGTGGRTNRPHYDGVDDYLHQAADQENWPDGIVYAPNGDNKAIKSLGVHEHWNNANEKLYTRNIYKSSDLPENYGIDLVSVPSNLVKHLNKDRTNTGIAAIASDCKLVLYPNPATDYVNIKYTIPSELKVKIEISNLSGRSVFVEPSSLQSAGTHLLTWNIQSSTSEIRNGIYLCRIILADDHGETILNKKIVVNK